MSAGKKPITGAKRAALLDGFRRAQHRERAALSATERLQRAEETRALGRHLHGRKNTRSDETAEILLRVRQMFRERLTR